MLTGAPARPGRRVLCLPAHTTGMSTKTVNRSRQPSGRPTGGQYAAEAKSDSGLVLGGEGDELVLSASEAEHFNALVEQADRSARMLANRRRFGQAWDAEDLASDVKLEIIARAKRNGTISNMSTSWVRYYTNGLVARVAEVTRHGRSPQEHYRANSSNMAAFKSYDAKMREFENAAGRSMTNSERDAVAEQIRQDWHDADHRPQEGFHLSVHNRSLDAERAGSADGGRGSGLDHISPAASAEDEYVDAQAMSWEEAEVDEDVRMALLDTSGRAGRKYQWNAMCAQNDIPKAPRGSMNNRQIAKTRTIVGTTNADIAAVCDDWDSALENDRVREFFRPFGAMNDVDHQGQIMDVIRKHPGQEAHLFSLALAAATARNFKDA